MRYKILINLWDSMIALFRWWQYWVNLSISLNNSSINLYSSCSTILLASNAIYTFNKVKMINLTNGSGHSINSEFIFKYRNDNTSPPENVSHLGCNADKNNKIAIPIKKTIKIVNNRSIVKHRVLKMKMKNSSKKKITLAQVANSQQGHKEEGKMSLAAQRKVSRTVNNVSSSS